MRSAPETAVGERGESGRERPVVCFEEVRFGYGAEPVVADADFDIFRGESVCVIGPNGGGKSTLLKLLLGLLRPDTGRVRLFGKRPEQTRFRVGYVPQQIYFDPLFPVTAYDVVLMGRLRRGSVGFRSRADSEAAMRSLRQMGLEAAAGAPFSSLSGGQRQAALIGRALASDPELLVLDEPTAHVDAVAETALGEQLDALRREEGRTVITVSHDFSFVSRAVGKVLCVNRGVHLHPTTMLTEDRLRELYGADLGLVRHDREHEDSHGGHRHA